MMLTDQNFIQKICVIKSSVGFEVLAEVLSHIFWGVVLCQHGTVCMVLCQHSTMSKWHCQHGIL
jgi:hypothetical protein